jgi:hypothetical protein
MKSIDKIPAGNPFKVPENYFEEVTGKIISSTVENQSEIKKPVFYLKLRPYIAIAASVAVMLVLSYTGIKLFPPRDKSLSLSGISVEEYSESILNDIDLLTLEEIAEFPRLPGEQDDQFIDTKDIIEYLMLENIDINEIRDQL